MQSTTDDGGVEGRRRQRLVQLAQLTDEQFAAEVQQHQAARWRAVDLENHARAHRRDFLDLLGVALTPSDLAALSQDVLRSWERLFTELEYTGATSYMFVRTMPLLGGALLVVSRGGRIRSAFPTRDFAAWQRRHSAAIEVTDHAARLGR